MSGGEGNPGKDRDIEKLKERMKKFALAVIALTEKFPSTPVARVISYQAIKSSTSSGANYRAACRARSKADFVSKMGIVEEELDETLYWLDLSQSAGLLSASDVQWALQEGDELLRIVVSSVKTARGRQCGM